MGNGPKSRLIYASLLSIVFISYQNCSDISIESGSSEVLPHLSQSIRVCYQPGQFVKSSFVMNLSAAFDDDGRMKMDSDRDGLADVIEGQTEIVQRFGISYLSADANSDGYSDLLQYRAGILRDQVQTLASCEDPVRDTDSDGMPDCEEIVARTLIDNPDTDGDGIIDSIEYRLGLNPTDDLDANSDLDGDGVMAQEEVKYNLPLLKTNSALHDIHRFQWSTEFTENENGDSCEVITVSNIALYPTRNGNRIRTFIMMSNSIGEDQIRNVVVTTHPTDYRDLSVEVLLDGQDFEQVNLPAKVEGL